MISYSPYRTMINWTEFMHKIEAQYEAIFFLFSKKLKTLRQIWRAKRDADVLSSHESCSRLCASGRKVYVFSHLHIGLIFFLHNAGLFASTLSLPSCIRRANSRYNKSVIAKFQPPFKKMPKRRVRTSTTVNKSLCVLFPTCIYLFSILANISVPLYYILVSYGMKCLIFLHLESTK